MNSPASHAKLVAALQTACICATIDAVVILILGTLMNSYLDAAGLSLLFFGPVALWIAAPLYRHLLRRST